MTMTAKPRLYFVKVWLHEPETGRQKVMPEPMLVWAFTADEARDRLMKEWGVTRGSVLSVVPYLGRVPDDKFESRASTASMQEHELGFVFKDDPFRTEPT
jgi:hypothetical protein